MKRSVFEDSSHVQHMVASRSPNWWHINNMSPPSQPPPPPPPPLAPPTSSWNDNQDFLDSWSQPLMGGLYEEEIKSSLINNMQEANKLENFEEQYVKLENSSSNSFNNKKNVEFQDMAIKSPSILSHQIMPTFSPRSSCVTSSSSNFFEFSTKSNARHPPPDHHSLECNSSASGSSAKKARVQPSSSQSTFKARKEKLGDRITALHQIVCPFGKTDTASVLLEAIGYIRFLHNQIEALSIPYLVSESGNMKQEHQPNPNDSHEEAKKDLSSRGLCLVPISYTMQVETTDNGADYWAPTFSGNFNH